MTTTTSSPVEETPDSRLSTAPVPLPPAAPGRAGLLAPVRRTWRQLTSMRTALLLLFLLALASVPGSFLPQRGLNPVAVQDYFAAHPTLAPVLDRLFLFDVFAAPWFAAVYLLLFVSLIGCLGPRIRLHAKALRTPPPHVPRVLARMPASDRWSTGRLPDEVLDAAAARLRGWRTVRTATGISAERGYLRETGQPALPRLAGGAAHRHRDGRAARLPGHRPGQGGRRLRQHRPGLRRHQARAALRPAAARAVQLRAGRLPGHLRRQRQGAHLQRRPALRRGP
jgi:hypothetical protein